MDYEDRAEEMEQDQFLQHRDQQEQEIHRLRGYVAELEAIVERLLNDAPSCRCDHVHHEWSDCHKIGEPCPVEARWAATVKAAEAVRKVED